MSLRSLFSGLCAQSHLQFPWNAPESLSVNPHETLLCLFLSIFSLPLSAFPPSPDAFSSQGWRAEPLADVGTWVKLWGRCALSVSWWNISLLWEAARSLSPSLSLSLWLSITPSPILTSQIFNYLLGRIVMKKEREKMGSLSFGYCTNRKSDWNGIICWYELMVGLVSILILHGYLDMKLYIVLNFKNRYSIRVSLSFSCF